MKSFSIAAVFLFFTFSSYSQINPKDVKVLPGNLPPNVIKEVKIPGIDNNRLLNNWNFEGGNLTSWTAEGNAFSNQPTNGGISVSKTSRINRCSDGSIAPITDVSWNHGIQGNYWISSGENHPAAIGTLSETYIFNTTGTLFSKEFTTTNDLISFLLAGKSASKNCSVNLLLFDDGTAPHRDTIVTTVTRAVAGRPLTVPERQIITYPVVTVGGRNYVVINKIINTLPSENDFIRTANPAALSGLDAVEFKRVSIAINQKFKGKILRISIEDNDTNGYVSADDFRFENNLSAQPVVQIPRTADCPLTGIIDLHTHPMSYLGFGRKAVHGVLDIGSIIPAGTNNCNPGELRATSIEQALGSCNSTHGGWGIDNGCGDYLRAAIINYALDADFKYVVPFERNPHGDHEHAGYPAFSFWPHHSSILHQQMWVDWIRRAHQGGINTIVALTVNSELLATITNGDGPYDDKSVADLQIDEMKAFVSRHADFMEIAYTPADMRRIVKERKLAVVLGMEIDKIGNFGKPGVVTNETTVRAEIRRLYSKGIRYAFPIHLIDNAFGGTSVYSMLFNFANKHANGYHFRVQHSNDPNVQYSADVRVEGAPTPAGLDNSLILGIRGLLQGIGEIPAPCFNDAIKCFPPPGKIRCCGSYESIMNIMNPSSELDVYKFIPAGHMNATGLSRLGEVAINEMMKLGIMIDIDHMGELSMERAIQIAEGVAGRYPLIMGHNAIRGTNEHTMKERSAPTRLVNRVAALGGMFGVGTSDISPEEFVTNANNAWAAMGNKNIAIGSDVNGFERLPKLGKYTSLTQQEFNLGTFTPPYGRCTTGTKTWNYVKDGGVSHYGMMPEFFWDVKTNYSGGNAVMNRLNNSVEQFTKLWEQVERVKRSVL